MMFTVTYKAAGDLARKLGLSPTQAMAALGMPLNHAEGSAVWALQAGHETALPKTSGQAYCDLLTIAEGMGSVFKDKGLFLYMIMPNPAFGGRSPVEMMETPEGLTAVLQATQEMTGIGRYAYE